LLLTVFNKALKLFVEVTTHYCRYFPVSLSLVFGLNRCCISTLSRKLTHFVSPKTLLCFYRLELKLGLRLGLELG